MSALFAPFTLEDVLTLLPGLEMNRREFLVIFGGPAGWPLGVQAQQAGKSRRIGFLRVEAPPPLFIEGFRQGLREQGWTEGQDIAIEWGIAPSVARLRHCAEVSSVLRVIARQRCEPSLSIGS